MNTLRPTPQNLVSTPRPNPQRHIHEARTATLVARAGPEGLIENLPRCTNFDSSRDDVN